MGVQDLLDGTIGDQRMDLANLPSAEVEKFVHDAEAALSYDERIGLAGEPILVAIDVASQSRLPNLVPDQWKSSLTDMIMNAVEHQDWA